MDNVQTGVNIRLGIRKNINGREMIVIDNGRPLFGAQITANQLRSSNVMLCMLFYIRRQQRVLGALRLLKTKETYVAVLLINAEKILLHLRL